MSSTRAWLFVPGDSARKIERALAGDADVLILDWEDAVAPAAKPAARAETSRSLAAASADPRRVWIRVNALDSPEFEADLAALPAARIGGVLLPKACGPDDVERLARRLDDVERAAGVAAGTLGIVAIATETCASVLALSEFRRPLPRLRGLLWGGEDLAGDLGVARNRDDAGRYRAPFRLARELVLMAAAAARCDAIDAVFVDVRDLDALARECAEARADGFVAKAVIHPGQVAPVREAFAPTTAERDWARRVLDALGDGAGVAMVDGRMVDAPHARIARRILAD